MTLHTPLWLWALCAVLPLAIALLIYGARRTRAGLAGLVAPRLREQLIRSVDFRKRRVKAVLFLGTLAFLLMALARPQFGFRDMEVERSSVDFFIALDLSRSMLAEDQESKQRLEMSKQALNRVLERVAGDRVGLIAFAGDAFVAAPITQDYEAVRRNLAALDTNSIAKPGSDIAAAIRLAQKTLESGKYETKALVLLTDGEELQGDAVIAAREAAQKGMTIFTVGVGSAMGGRIPDAKQGGGAAKFAKNEFGRDVLTRLNERALQQIAASGRGFYEPLGTEGAGLLSAYNRGLQPLAKGTVTRASKDKGEYFQWPLTLALALLLAEMLVNERRQQKPQPRGTVKSVAPSLSPKP
ncbi:MAG TPA: VWA domain-containing protein [Chthoniobacteraceae bacterium]|jgi:Ca-activated chloride channel family protein